MSYFGEFLVEKKAIKSDQLIEALIEQMNQQPLLVEIVWKKKLLPAEKIVQVFHYQQDNQVEFIQACKSLALWNSEMESVIGSELNQVRLPLGQVLIKKGCIQLKDLTKYLDEYLAISQITQETIEPTMIEKSEDVDFQPGIVMELFDSFSEKKYSTLKAAFSLIKDQTAKDPAEQEKLMNNSFKILKSVQEGIFLLGMEKMSQIIDEMLKKMTQFSEDKKNAQNISSQLYSALEVAWDLRESIVLNASEKCFFQIGDNLVNFNAHLN
jgi:hypothetical protein